MSEVYSQTRIKIIDSSSREPISDVIIYSSSIKLISDQTGYFQLDHLREDELISFSHISYEMLVLKYSELFNLAQIELTRKYLETNQIEVVSENNSENTVISEKIDLDQYTRSSFLSVSDVLNSKTSLVINDYGGEGSVKTVSSRGLSSENTLILFNEARVNDLRTGTFDLSQLDLFAIDRIEYAKNSSSDNLTAGGVLKINSENGKNQNSALLGGMVNNISTKKIFGNLNYSNNGFSFGTNFIHSNSPNEYKYIFDGEEYSRKNAQYSKTFFNGDMKWSTTDLLIKFYIHYSHLSNGLPGYVVTNNSSSSKASNLTNSWLGITNINYALSKDLTFLSTLSYHNQYLVFEDPENQLLIDRDSQSSTFGDLSFSNKLTYDFENLSMLLGYTISNSNVDSLTTYISGIHNFNSGERTEHNIYTSINYLLESQYFQQINFSAGLNYQLIDDNIYDQSFHNYLSYKFGISFSPLFAKRSTILASFSSNYRHPTFNEKYYSGFFGNSDLAGEEYQTLNLGINSKFSMIEEEEFEITLFKIWGTNRIIWAPTILAIQIPRNISEVESNGLEFKFNQSLFNSLFIWEILYTYTKALNKSAQSESDNTYNKQIIYTPLHRFNLNANFNISDFRFSINSLFVGKRYYTPDNTERNTLDPYFVVDLSASYIFNISNIENLLTLNIYNIFDEDYNVIQSYPMPLKTVSINYQVRF